MPQAQSLHGDVHAVRYDDNKMKASRMPVANSSSYVILT